MGGIWRQRERRRPSKWEEWQEPRCEMEGTWLQPGSCCRAWWFGTSSCKLQTLAGQDVDLVQSATGSRPVHRSHPAAWQPTPHPAYADFDSLWDGAWASASWKNPLKVLCRLGRAGGRGKQKPGGDGGPWWESSSTVQSVQAGLQQGEKVAI